MDLAQLEVFLAVAREGRFSRAAEKLYRTQSAVSQSIRKLEEEVGEALFDRSSRDGVLTDAGHVLQEYAERLLNLRSDARQALVELRELHKGKPRRKRDMSWEHNYVETLLFGLLFQQLDRNEFQVRSDSGRVRRSSRSYYIPDIFVAPAEIVRAHRCERGLEFYDMPVVRGIVHDAARTDYKFSSIIMGIVKSTPFQMRKSGGL